MKHHLRSSIVSFLASYLLPGLLSFAIAQETAPHSDTPSTAPAGPPTPEGKKKNERRSSEWKKLPKQKWEIFDIGRGKIPVIAAFDNDTKNSLNNFGGFDAQAIPATDPISALGQIIGSRTESEYFFVNDVVYINSKGQIQVGDTYAITDTPEILKSSKSDRTGYSYLILGKVKILAVRDDLYLGKMTSVRSFVPRGALLIPTPPKVLDIIPLAGPSAVEGTLIFDHRFSTFTSAQHKEVFIDRGSADGLKPGMVFRIYQHYDPSNEKKISSSELIVDGEVRVTQVTESFSTGVVIQSYSTIVENSSAVLMTDISDLIKPPRAEAKGTELDKKLEKAKPQDPLEELDRLDTVQSLAASEKKKLHQLEKWQVNPTGNTPKALNAAPPLPEAKEAIPTPEASLPAPPASTSAVEATPTAGASVDSLPPQNTVSPEDSTAQAPPSTGTPPADNSTSSKEIISADVPPPPLLEDSAPPPPPMVPVKAEATPLPPSAAAGKPQKVEPKASSEPDLPPPPPPEL